MVMLLMALDHVRGFVSPFPYEPTDLSQASAGLFLTRWITHWCAPTFIFLAGTSAFLYGRHVAGTRRELQGFLLKRGLWLVLVDVAWGHFPWSLPFDGRA